MFARDLACSILVVVVAFVASSAEAIELSGYFRDSIGFNSKGGGQGCFQLPGSDFKARLGNECDHYLEIKLSETKKVGNNEWRVEFMPAQYIPTIDGLADHSVFVQEMWAGLRYNDWGGINLWVGRRYFQRHDVHEFDFFYWNPMQGHTAIGVEDINLGFGKAALTLIRINANPGAGTGTPEDPITKDLVRGTYAAPDLRFYDIPVNPDGTLEVGVDLAIAADRANTLGPDRAKVSPLFTLQHNQANLLGGSNTLVFQYGLGAFAHSSGDGPNILIAGGTSDHQQWRVIEHLVVQPVAQLSSGLVLIYQNKSTPGATSNGSHTITAEIRPIYHFNDFFGLAVDAAYQRMSIKNAPEGTGTPELTKLTLAPTFTLEPGYWVRPEIRLFVTYGKWNTAAASAGTMAAGAFGKQKQGLTMGGHIEMWF